MPVVELVGCLDAPLVARAGKDFPHVGARSILDTRRVGS